MEEPSLELTPQTAALAGAAEALESAGVSHWFFGGWAVDLWVGRVTRAHDDIDVLVQRSDEAKVHEALTAAGWVHTPQDDDLVGTNYAGDGYELQLTFVETDDEGRVVVRVPGEPIVVSPGPLAHERRPLGHLHVRVMTLESMLEGKAEPRPDDAGGDKDRADLAALRAVAERR
ncbi:hypothetical protein [Nocardioides sp. zg-1230]|jgi:hypothetical protein|uniref:nucleotidyltransferase domain-containing protein n=1 Tax=Nocardioides sp. zg-1230 TaxID=2736601 RepID=UPI001C13201B|nr:hypothetical protein [Nocardioides sp. zg-1230]